MMTDVSKNEVGPTREGKQGLLATGGIFGALAASSCCILPLALTLFGVSGAWMGSLRALEPYQPYFIAGAIGALGYGFFQVYWQQQDECEEGEVCARPLPNRLVKTGLWTGAGMVLIVLSFPYWFPLIADYLP